jgi:hypothetical protein
VWGFFSVRYLLMSGNLRVFVGQILSTHLNVFWPVFLCARYLYIYNNTHNLWLWSENIWNKLCGNMRVFSCIAYLLCCKNIFILTIINWAMSIGNCNIFYVEELCSWLRDTCPLSGAWDLDFCYKIVAIASLSWCIHLTLFLIL